MNGLCPACRRPYDEKNIQWKAISPEEMAQHRQNQAQKARKNQQAKQKEIQKREADNLSRKHLAGLRVRQRNLVYVTGMKPKIQGDKLIEILRGPQYFGQYGDIVKIVVATPSKPTQQSVGIYVTFARNEDAAMCIQTMNNHYNDGTVRAQYGTTKYCSAYLRGETCNNRSCMFLHEPGDENERYTRQDLSNLNASSMQQPPQVGISQVSHPLSQPQPSMQESVPISTANPDNDSAVSPTDTSALPASANWGNQARRASRANTASTTSPMATSSTPAPTAPEPKDEIPQASELEEKKLDSNSEPSEAPATSPEQPKAPSKPKKQRIPYLDDLWKKAFDPAITFKFSFAQINPQNREIIERMPPLWDPRAYARRRETKEREEEELRRRQEESAQSELRPGDTNPELEETAEAGGSLQLGGEPEERPDRAFPQSQQSAIQPPSQQGLGNANFGFGQQLGLGDELSGLGGPSRGLTPQQMQQQQRVQQQELLLQQLKGPQSTSQHHFSASSHVRQNSRFSFNEPGSATTVKPTANSNLLKQQASLIGQSSHFNSLNQHQPLGNQFFSGVQGPPPGLKSTGTPPVSGGGMFGQGHGFTPGVGYGANSSRETDKWESYRGQRGAQLPDAGKREFMFPSYLHQHPSTSSSSPAPGLLSFPYGPQPGSFQESGSQKQKKKGKKHRHANTSSSSGGGGLVDVSDPSILQARMHHNGSLAGQGLYGNQGQGGFSSMYGSGFGGRW
jgi:CCR4-NOT transcription complex subunit 4